MTITEIAVRLLAGGTCTTTTAALKMAEDLLKAEGKAPAVEVKSLYEQLVQARADIVRLGNSVHRLQAEMSAMRKQVSDEERSVPIPALTAPMTTLALTPENQDYFPKISVPDIGTRSTRG